MVRIFDFTIPPTCSVTRFNFSITDSKMCRLSVMDTFFIANVTIVGVIKLKFNEMTSKSMFRGFHCFTIAASPCPWLLIWILAWKHLSCETTVATNKHRKSLNKNNQRRKFFDCLIWHTALTWNIIVCALTDIFLHFIRTQQIWTRLY
jgi:hypothetical protein